MNPLALIAVAFALCYSQPLEFEVASVKPSAVDETALSGGFQFKIGRQAFDRATPFDAIHKNPGLKIKSGKVPIVPVEN